MIEIDKVVFRDNLLLTQNYCVAQLINSEKNHASILRSINPVVNEKNIFDFRFVTNYTFRDVKISIPEIHVFDFHSQWTNDPLTDDTFIASLFEQQLNVKAAMSTERSFEAEGEILVVRFRETVVDGASQGESRGFIDEYDFPPIDTWFYKVNRKDGPVLFAWIPKQFVWLVTKAIEVNVLDMIQWFKIEYPDRYKSIME